MNLQKFQQQLLREMKRKPKKAALLGLLALVAAYFWVPLVWGWFAPAEAAQESPASATAMASQRPEEASPVAAAVPSGAKSVPSSWQELLRLMEQDPRRKPGDGPMPSRDPFARNELQEEKDSLRITKPAAKTNATPQELGLKLGGTIVGQRGLALINGRPYAVGNKVRTVDNVEFIITEIAAKRVMLKRNGEAFPLSMPSPDADSLQITRMVTSDE